jgi:hypothetical protein
MREAGSALVNAHSRPQAEASAKFAERCRDAAALRPRTPAIRVLVLTPIFVADGCILLIAVHVLPLGAGSLGGIRFGGDVCLGITDRSRPYR